MIFSIGLNSVFLLLVLEIVAKVNSNRGEKSQCYEDTLQPTYGNVIFSAMLFRHGDRYEFFTWPTDPYQNYMLQAGIGELTKAGKQRAYRLGQWAQKYYAKYLGGEPYRANVVNITSADLDRSMRSAELFLAGFYPPKFENETWNNGLGLVWQPIPVYTIPLYEDNLIRTCAYCARYDLEVSLRVKTSNENKHFYRKYGATLDYIERYTKLSIPRDNAVLAINTVYSLCDSLLVEKQLGLKQPEWARKIFPNPCEFFEESYFKELAFNDVTKRLKGGPLMKRIITDMVLKRNNNSTLFMDIFSGQDNTIAVILSFLNVFDGTPPPYSATVLIELRQKNSDYFVTVSYKTSENEAPNLLELPNCKNPCTLDSFIQATLPLIPDDWQKDCNDLGLDYNNLLFA